MARHYSVGRSRHRHQLCRKRRALPDYRGGSPGRTPGVTRWLPNPPAFLLETNADEVFVSRFNNDFLTYSQTRVGFTLRPCAIPVNANVTVDSKQQYWANFVEAGPGVASACPILRNRLLFSVNGLRGVYLVNADNPRTPNFYDLRAGFWYAITH